MSVTIRSLIPTDRGLLVGEVLDAGFRLFRASLLRCLPLSATSVVAAQGPTLYDAAMGRSFSLLGSKDVGWWVVYVVAVIVSVWMIGLVFRAQDALARSVPWKLRADLVPTLWRTPGAVVVSLAVLAPVVLAVVAYAVNVLPGALTAVALLPAAWLGVRLAFVPCLYWCERRSVWRALAGGFRLLSGSFWRTCAVLVVMLMTVMVFYFVIAILLAVLAPSFGARDAALLLALQAVVAMCVGAVGMPFATALLVVAADDLRWRQTRGHGGTTAA
jgi:hypothetical protein